MKLVKINIKNLSKNSKQLANSETHKIAGGHSTRNSGQLSCHALN
ncbi:hypothetical protein [Pseudoalteromonas umbrosa]|nr:hypothetical protein [Pseudoalteromonas sp. B95]MDK1286951.1 hypothetical protein [Pseudoalteromonas sp. B95]